MMNEKQHISRLKKCIILLIISNAISLVTIGNYMYTAENKFAIDHEGLVWQSEIIEEKRGEIKAIEKELAEYKWYEERELIREFDYIQDSDFRQNCELRDRHKLHQWRDYAIGTKIHEGCEGGNADIRAVCVEDNGGKSWEINENSCEYRDE